MMRQREWRNLLAGCVRGIQKLVNTLVRRVKITRACACVKDGKKPQNLLFLGKISFYYYFLVSETQDLAKR